MASRSESSFFERDGGGVFYAEMTENHFDYVIFIPIFKFKGEGGTLLDTPLAVYLFTGSVDKDFDKSNLIQAMLAALSKYLCDLLPHVDVLVLDDYERGDVNLLLNLGNIQEIS